MPRTLSLSLPPSLPAWPLLSQPPYQLRSERATAVLSLWVGVMFFFPFRSLVINSEKKKKLKSSMGGVGLILGRALTRAASRPAASSAFRAAQVVRPPVVVTPMRTRAGMLAQAHAWNAPQRCNSRKGRRLRPGNAIQAVAMDAVCGRCRNSMQMLSRSACRLSFASDVHVPALPDFRSQQVARPPQHTGLAMARPLPSTFFPAPLMVSPGQLRSMVIVPVLLSRPLYPLQALTSFFALPHRSNSAASLSGHACVS